MRPCTPFQTTGALGEAEQGFDLAPNSVPTNLFLGDVLAQMNRPEEARIHYQRGYSWPRPSNQHSKPDGCRNCGKSPDASKLGPCAALRNRFSRSLCVVCRSLGHQMLFPRIASRNELIRAICNRDAALAYAFARSIRFSAGKLAGPAIRISHCNQLRRTHYGPCLSAEYPALRRSAARSLKRVGRGEVRLRTEVHTTNQTILVPVTREELVMERVPTEGKVTVEGDAFTESEIRLPLSEERASVDKEALVLEEVHVGKKEVDSVESFDEKIRSEDLKVDEDLNTHA